MHTATELDEAVRNSMKLWEKQIGSAFSSDHIINLIRRDYGVTLSWTEALDLHSGKSFQSIVDAKKKVQRAELRIALIVIPIAVSIILGIFFGIGYLAEHSTPEDPQAARLRVWSDARTERDRYIEKMNTAISKNKTEEALLYNQRAQEAQKRMNENQ